MLTETFVTDLGKTCATPENGGRLTVNKEKTEAPIRAGKENGQFKKKS